MNKKNSNQLAKANEIFFILFAIYVAYVMFECKILFPPHNILITIGLMYLFGIDDYERFSDS